MTHKEPQTAQEIMDEFSGWSVARGTDMRWYARKSDSALVSGEDLLDLRDQIIGWLWRNEIR